MALAAFLLALLGLSPMANAASWNYEDPDTDWATLGSCGSSANQSPINITKADAETMDMSNFTTSMGYKISSTGSIVNNGHSIQWSADEMHGASIKGVPVCGNAVTRTEDDYYMLNQFHLHWGSVPGQGSEHCIDSFCYDAELHLVHYHMRYDNISMAVASGDNDALSVLGILIKEVEEFDQFSGVRDSTSVTNLKMAALELARPQTGPGPAAVTLTLRPTEFIDAISDLTGVYHYGGGLTTPGCNELVQWMVLDKPLLVQGNGLLKALRMLKDDHGDYIQDNYRPLQANGNQLYHFSP